MEFKIQVPKQDNTSGIEDLVLKTNSLVVVGANGSGKSRFGEAIEKQNLKSSGLQIQQSTHRITAQKSLEIPDTIAHYPSETAETLMLFGQVNLRARQNMYQEKFSYRYGGKPLSKLVTDFDKVLMLLIARRNERNEDAWQKSSNGGNPTDAGLSPDETLVKIWNDLLPHRQIEISSQFPQVVSVKMNNNNYKPSDMSDGERVIIYLISMVLCSPPNTILIIDEPEMHIHKSILYELWTKLEKAREDCLFVYITHDLDFAVSRQSAKKIWMKSYTNANGEVWNWEVIKPIDDIPEDLTLLVLGNRKPTIFVEGQSDLNLFQQIYPEYLVISCGNAGKVIQSTKAFLELSSMHYFKVYGIIDRDRRPDDELAALANKGIFALEVAEVENLYCIPEIIETFANWDGQKPANEALQEAKQKLFELIQEQLDNQVLRRSEYIVEHKMHKLFGGKHEDHKAIINKLKSLSKDIDVVAIEQEGKQLFQDALQKQDYRQALRLYNQKGFVADVARILGRSKNDFLHLLHTKLISQDENLRKAIKQYLPKELQ